MISRQRLFTPGPTTVRPSAQLAMAAAGMHHRSPEFRALYLRVQAQLQQFVGTTSDVVVLSCSSTGAMEAAVSNVTSPGDRVLVLSAGRYGERFVSAAKNFGCAVDVVKKPYGETFALDEVKAALKLETRAVFVQACETSTGTEHDVRAIAQLMNDMDSEALLVVDAVTALGATAMDMDAWGVDVLIGASETALMAPPGLSFLAVNEKAWDRMEATYNPRYFFDLRKERKNAGNGETAYTPSVPLFAAVSAALDAVAALGDGKVAAGRDALIANAQRMATMTRAACAALGLRLVSVAPSFAATAVLVPDGATVCDVLRARFGAVVLHGQGELQGKALLVSHAGSADFMDTMALLAALEQVLVADMHLPGVQLGTALVAAQKAFAEGVKR